jgi:hypothetical protein
MRTLIIMLLVSAMGLAVSAARLSSETVRDVVERLLQVVQGMADLSRRGSETVLARAYGGLQRVFHSTGLTGEHFWQRLFGMSFVTVSGLMGLLVGTLSLAGAFAGLFGSASHWAEKLPFSELLALELTLVSLLIGTLLLDLLGVTRWSIYGRESFAPRARNILAGLSLLLACVSLYLFYLAGALRGGALFLDAPQPPVSYAGDYIVRAVPDSSVAAPLASGEPTMSLAPAMASKAKVILVGIPLLAMIGSLLAGPVLVSGMGLGIAAVLFLLIGAMFGSLWVIATVIIRLTDLCYNLLLAFAAAFSQPPGPNPPRPSAGTAPQVPHDPLPGAAAPGEATSDQGQAQPGGSATMPGIQSPAQPAEAEPSAQRPFENPQPSPMDGAPADVDPPPAEDPLWNPVNFHSTNR